MEEKVEEKVEGKAEANRGEESSDRWMARRSR